MVAGAAQAAACIAACALAGMQAGCGAPHTGAAPVPASAPASAQAQTPATRSLNGQPTAAAHAVSAAGATRKPACAYITREQMAQLLRAPVGTPIEEQEDGSSSCAYPPG